MDSGFLKLNPGFQSLGFWIPQAKISRILESDCLKWGDKELVNVKDNIKSPCLKKKKFMLEKFYIPVVKKPLDFVLCCLSGFLNRFLLSIEDTICPI